MTYTYIDPDGNKHVFKGFQRAMTYKDHLLCVVWFDSSLECFWLENKEAVEEVKRYLKVVYDVVPETIEVYKGHV